MFDVLISKKKETNYENSRLTPVLELELGI